MTDATNNGPGRDENALRVAFRKPEGKRTFGKSRYRWEDDININAKEMIYEGGNAFIGYGYGSVESSSEHGNESWV